jgi:hypothetical protein
LYDLSLEIGTKNEGCFSIFKGVLRSDGVPIKRLIELKEKEYRFEDVNGNNGEISREQLEDIFAKTRTGMVQEYNPISTKKIFVEFK